MTHLSCCASIVLLVLMMSLGVENLLKFNLKFITQLNESH